jgi:hypothetical protein
MLFLQRTECAFGDLEAIAFVFSAMESKRVEIISSLVAALVD